MATRAGSAMLWVRLALAGALLLLLTSFLALLRLPLMPVHGCSFWAGVWEYRLRVAAILVPSAVGLSVMVWAERRFTRGFRAALWTDLELRRIRRLLGHKAWGALGGVAILVPAISLFAQHSLRGFELLYFILLPSQMAQRMRSLITPRVERGSGLADWRKVGPLRSEHWGERNA